MAHEVENMFFVGEVPWHGLGKRLEGRPTTEEAIKAAGLDWEVGMKPLFTSDAAGMVDKAVQAKATYRKSDGRILGVVGTNWTPLQNAQAFKFFDPFLTTGEAVLETAGSLREGGRVWVLAQLNLEPAVIVAKADDVVRKYVLLSNGHDGTQAVRVGFTPVRVVCANTLAMSHANAESKLLRIRHHKNVAAALEAVRDVMNTANQSFEATAAQYRDLASKEVNAECLKKYVNLVFAPKRVELAERLAAAGEEGGLTAEQLRSNVYPKIVELFEGGRGNDLPGVKGTYWAAYNAISEYLVHERGKDAEKRLDSAWFGTGTKINARALKVGHELAVAA